MNKLNSDKLWNPKFQEGALKGGSRLKVIPQKIKVSDVFVLKLTVNVFYQALFRKDNKNHRSLCSLKRCDGPIFPSLCLYSG